MTETVCIESSESSAMVQKRSAGSLVGDGRLLVAKTSLLSHQNDGNIERRRLQLPSLYSD